MAGLFRVGTELIKTEVKKKESKEEFRCSPRGQSATAARRGDGNKAGRDGRKWAGHGKKKPSQIVGSWAKWPSKEETKTFAHSLGSLHEHHPATQEGQGETGVGRFPFSNIRIRPEGGEPIT